MGDVGTEYQVTVTRKENEVSPGHLKMKFSPPLTFKNPRKMCLKLQSAAFPNTFYNITAEKKNNLFGIDVIFNGDSEWTRIQSILPDGYYSMDQLMWLFFQLQKEAKIVDCVQDELTGENTKYIFPVHWLLNEANTHSTFVIRKTTKILKVKFQIGWWGGLEKQIGFTNEEANNVSLIVDSDGDSFAQSVSSVSPNRLFDDVGKFSILCPFTSSSYGSSRSSNVLYSDIFSGAANTLQIYPSNGMTTPLLPLEVDAINDLDFFIVNELSGSPIDFHDENYYITVVFVQIDEIVHRSFV